MIILVDNIWNALRSDFFCVFKRTLRKRRTGGLLRLSCLSLGALRGICPAFNEILLPRELTWPCGHPAMLIYNA